MRLRQHWLGPSNVSLGESVGRAGCCGTSRCALAVCERLITPKDPPLYTLLVACRHPDTLPGIWNSAHGSSAGLPGHIAWPDTLLTSAQQRRRWRRRAQVGPVRPQVTAAVRRWPRAAHARFVQGAGRTHYHSTLSALRGPARRSIVIKSDPGTLTSGGLAAGRLLPPGPAEHADQQADDFLRRRQHHAHAYGRRVQPSGACYHPLSPPYPTVPVPSYTSHKPLQPTQADSSSPADALTGPRGGGGWACTAGHQSSPSELADFHERSE
jgi:hypothetical protein